MTGKGIEKWERMIVCERRSTANVLPGTGLGDPSFVRCARERLTIGDCRGWSRQRGSRRQMSDRTVTCRDCGNAFVFTAGEQAFYTERGFSEPQRCPTCRAARKSQRNGGDSSGGGSSYSGGGSSYSGGGSSYGGGSGGYSSGSSYSDGGSSGYSNAPRQMFAAVCSGCGKETEVPFQPRMDRPVYCRDCFQERRTSAPRGGGYGNSY